MRVLEQGSAEFHTVDPDGFREWVREHKGRVMEPKLMSEKEAVARYVEDGDYLVYDCEYLHRGPSSLEREVIRQGKRDLWIGGKFTYVDVGLFLAGGCISKVDVGYFGAGPPVTQAVLEGRVQMMEYSNVIMTMRLKAGAMGLPFIPVRSFGGTTGFTHSGAKLVEDPYTGRPIVIVPALNPDVALIHVQQADAYGNARVFGTGIAHRDCALASRKVIISAEEIIDTEEIRRDPGRTSIPFYVVDAVVEASFGAYPGECQGYYATDVEHVGEVFGAIQSTDGCRAYVEKYVFSVADHQEMLEKRVGTAKLLEMRRRATIREGYQA
ncbi:MAG: CoA transferase subunit A [Dehalococcoidia bacterium]